MAQATSNDQVAGQDRAHCAHPRHSERFIFKQQRDELIMKIRAMSSQNILFLFVSVPGLISGENIRWGWKMIFWSRFLFESSRPDKPAVGCKSLKSKLIAIKNIFQDAQAFEMAWNKCLPDLESPF